MAHNDSAAKVPRVARANSEERLVAGTRSPTPRAVDTAVTELTSFLRG